MGMEGSQTLRRIKLREGLKTYVSFQPPCQFRMFQQEQAYRHQREHEHHRMNIFATADNQIKANMRNEAPEYSLGNREGQGDEDYSQKRRKTLLNFTEIDVADTFEHRRTDQNQNRRSCVDWNHPGERREKEARQKTERRKHRGHSCKP